MQQHGLLGVLLRMGQHRAPRDEAVAGLVHRHGVQQTRQQLGLHGLQALPRCLDQAATATTFGVQREGVVLRMQGGTSTPPAAVAEPVEGVERQAQPMGQVGAVVDARQRQVVQAQGGRHHVGRAKNPAPHDRRLALDEHLAEGRGALDALCQRLHAEALPGGARDREHLLQQQRQPARRFTQRLHGTRLQ